MDPFKRRYFRSPGEFLASLASIVGRLDALPGYLRGRVDQAFSQRLWLGVTSVNGCRYCAWLHSKLALQSGVAAEEVEALSSGGITNTHRNSAPPSSTACTGLSRTGVPIPRRAPVSWRSTANRRPG